MDSLGKLLGNFIVRNDNEISLFKVMLYENGLTFDNKFLKGVIENEKTYSRFETINELWASKKYEKEFIVEKIMSMLQESQEYLSEFFYNTENLDESGNLIEEEEVEQSKDKHVVYYDYLKKSGKLNKIERKEFEKKIVDKKVGDYYVENFDSAKNDAEFFTYKSEKEEDCYIMVLNDAIKIGFAEG